MKTFDEAFASFNLTEEELHNINDQVYKDILKHITDESQLIEYLVTKTRQIFFNETHTRTPHKFEILIFLMGYIHGIGVKQEEDRMLKEKLLNTIFGALKAKDSDDSKEKA